MGEGNTVYIASNSWRKAGTEIKYNCLPTCSLVDEKLFESNYLFHYSTVMRESFVASSFLPAASWFPDANDIEKLTVLDRTAETEEKCCPPSSNCLNYHFLPSEWSWKFSSSKLSIKDCLKDVFIQYVSLSPPPPGSFYVWPWDGCAFLPFNKNINLDTIGLYSPRCLNGNKNIFPLL